MNCPKTVELKKKKKKKIKVKIMNFPKTVKYKKKNRKQSSKSNEFSKLVKSYGLPKSEKQKKIGFI